MDQVALEEEMLGLSIERYRNRQVRNEGRGMGTLNPNGKRALSLSVAPVATAIEQWLVDAKKKRGSRPAAFPYLRLFDPMISAAYACRALIDGASQQHTHTAVAAGLGTALQHEYTIQNMDADLRAGVSHNLDASPLGVDRRVRREQYLRAAAKFGEDVETWPRVDRLQIGTVLIEMVIRATGWFELVSIESRNRKGSVLAVRSTDVFTTLMSEYKERDEVLHPLFTPMVTPPLPWEAIFGGGYYTPRLKRPLVKFRGREHRQAVTEADLARPIQAVNTVQQTPWCINTQVLDVITALWDGGAEVAGLPPRHDRTPPPKPDFEKDREAWIRWKKVAGEIFRRNRKDDSARLQTVRTLWLARRFREYPTIYMPHQFDFRGRVYAVPQLLNPQGSDLAKGLLQFANPKPLGVEGADWLAVHVANTWGEDKTSFSDRRKWVIDNEKWIVDCASNPLDNRRWADADKPAQFLAAAFAWADYRREGPSALCALPVYVDGSANGLQHYSAMLRDEVCGPLVNLVASPRPADLYQSVAGVVVDRLRGVRGDDRDLADRWLAFGITRSAVKRPVMVLPYGGTRDSTYQYLREWYMGEVDGGKEPLPHATKSLRWLAGILWSAMSERTVKAREAMDWLRKAARAKGNEPLRWTTPSGFVAFQRYANTRPRRIETSVGDVVYRAQLREEVDGIDTRKSAQAFPPNFVHSYDAAALVATINRASSEGISHFAVIHDSFGTVPGDVAKLLRILREEFHRLYIDRDPLTDLARELGVDTEPPPARGSLDLDEVLSSPFLFS